MSDRERDARAGMSTMDEAHIRGLVTAVHLSVAGRPRSWNGDRVLTRPLKNPEDSPHRARRRVADPTETSMCSENDLLRVCLGESAEFLRRGRPVGTRIHRVDCVGGSG